MQAVILAAGMGKRLKELTQDVTKCMIKVNGVTLIERMLSQLDALSLSRIVIVVGYQSERLISFIKTLDIKTPIIYVENSVYDKTNNIYSLYLARESLIEEEIPQDWAEAITEVAKKNITPPEVHISGYVDIETFVPNGVEVIIAALKAAEDNGDEEEEIKVQCVGAPRYRITVKSTDYILAEKALKAAADRCIAVVEESEGNGSFLRELDN